MKLFSIVFMLLLNTKEYALIKEYSSDEFKSYTKFMLIFYLSFLRINADFEYILFRHFECKVIAI